MFGSTSTITKGQGPSANFVSGFLDNHALNLTRAGNFTITTLSENDPSIVGSTSVTVNPGPAAKLTLITPSSKVNPNSTAFTTQPVVAITDVFGNVISNDNAAGDVTVSIEKQNGSSTFNSGLALSGTSSNIAFPTSGAAQHTFSGLSINQNGSYVLKFTPTKAGIDPVYDTVIVANTKIWYGFVSTAFNNADNWVSSGTGASTDIPATGDNVEFHSAPGHSCLLDVPRTLGSITIASNADASKSMFDLNGQVLTLQGDFVLSNLGKIKADGASSRLVMAGNRGSAQNLPKERFVNDAVYALELNNPNGVTLGGTNHHLKIPHMMNFTNGVLFTQANTNCIMFEDNATQPIGSDASHIEGKCSKVGDDTFVFPIGRNGKYAPCGISAPASVTDMFCAEYFPTNFVTTQKASGSATRTIKGNTTGGKFIDAQTRTLRKVSNKAYWEIDRKVGTSAVDISLYWNDKSYSEITSLTGLTVVHYDRQTQKVWENTVGNGAVTPKDNTTGTPSPVSILSTSVPEKGAITMEAVNNFSPFTFGDEDDISLLAVAYASFEVVAAPNSKVLVKWETSVEENSSHFDVLWSANGSDWDAIGQVASIAQNHALSSYSFVHQKPLDFNYYRLRHVALDGSISLSPVRTLSMSASKTVDVIIYPNPSLGSFTLEVNGDAIVELRDMHGKLIKSLAMKDSYSFEHLAKSVYFVQVIQGQYAIKRKCVVH